MSDSTASASGSGTRRDATTVLSALRGRSLLPLLEQICARRGVLAQEVCGPGRSQSVSYARQELWWAIRNLPDRHYSYPEIGRLFSMDHTTIRHGIYAHIHRNGFDDSRVA